MKGRLIFLFATLCFLVAAKVDDPQLPSRLSAWHPESNPEFVRYELATPLFTDYAEKARWIKVPKGAHLTVTGDGLPEFPDGTILVKTFFYWLDRRDTAKGRQLVETRVLLKSAGGWQAATYVWNREQTDATLTTTGEKMEINWIDETGAGRNIRYRVPTSTQCTTCHRSGKEIIPIGFKVRNLNVPVMREGRIINQLTYFSARGMMASIDPSGYSTLPAWNDTTASLEKRARAYLDVNCAHCHNEKGYCSKSDFRPAFGNSLPDTKIMDKKKSILRFLRSGRMPLLGTTVVHQEGLQLIANYLNKK